MATGYVVSGRGDLDALFMPRTSTAIANTGFKSNGGVDLAQRFEPRSVTIAVAATNLKAGATDLAQIFMDITAVPPVTDSYSLGAGGDASVAGYFNLAIHPSGLGTWTPTTTFKTNKVSRCYYRFFDTVFHFELYNDAGGGTPPDADSHFAVVRITGIFADSGGASVTRTVARSARSFTTTGTTSTGSFPCRLWVYTASTYQVPHFIAGNTYAVGLG